MKVEPAIEAAVASGRVPEEIPVEFLMETKDPQTITALIFIVVFTGVIVGARCSSRQFIVKSFGLDDTLALISMIMLIAFVVLSIVNINIGAGRHIEYLRFVLNQDQTNMTGTLDFSAHMIYTTALYVCRMSGLMFYLALYKNHDTFTLTIKSGAVFLTIAYLPQIFTIIFHCLPVTSLWPYPWEPTAPYYKCLVWGTVYLVNSGLSLVCDLLIFTIPVFMIKSLNVSRKKKIQLSFVLLPGVLVIALSIARMYLVVQGQWVMDGSWFYCPMLAIEAAEIGGTLIALSIPGLKPLVLRWTSAFSDPKSATSDGSESNQQHTIGSAPVRPKKNFSKFGIDTELGTMKSDTVRVRTRGRGAGDSDVNLVDPDTRDGAAIQVRRSLDVDSTSMNGGDNRLDVYPRTWDQKK